MSATANAPVAQLGSAKLFSACFKQSRNAMLLLDSHRLQVDANGAYLKLLGYKRDQIIGHPIYEFRAGDRVARSRWEALLAAGHFTGDVELLAADGASVGVQWAATVEVVTGHRLILFVALNTSRWGQRFRRSAPPDPQPGNLSERELTVVRLVAHGSSGPEIAEELQIAHDTVRTHVRNAMAKVGARSRAHLVAKAIGEGHALG
jgi:PAS domain S-box-containing protein